MAQINESIFLSNGYVDDIQKPFDTFADLKALKSTRLFNGLKCVVNNNNLPISFVFVGNVKQRFYWVIEKLPVFPTYGDLTAVTDDIVTTLGNRTKAFHIGLEATVQSGETTGEIEKYIVTEVTDGVPTWELMTMPSTDIKDDAEDVVDKVMNGLTGNVVYTNDMIYSYQPSGESGETIYTTVKEEAEGQPGYTEYPAGFYAIIEDSNGDACLASVVTNNKTDGLSIEIIGDDVE